MKSKIPLKPATKGKLFSEPSLLLILLSSKTKDQRTFTTTEFKPDRTRQLKYLYQLHKSGF